MKNRRLAIIPVSLTILLVFILFVPVIRASSGSMQVCNPQYCVDTVQYDSITYTYGGWGALFHTGVNSYGISSWWCSMACSPPYGGIIWIVIGVLFLADLLCTVLVVTRWSRGGTTVTIDEMPSQTAGVLRQSLMPAGGPISDSSTMPKPVFFQGILPDGIFETS